MILMKLYFFPLHEMKRFVLIILGVGGVTHNTLEEVHNHWKRAEAVRIKCLGVPTLDMDNICFHLEVSKLRYSNKILVVLFADEIAVCL